MLTDAQCHLIDQHLMEDVEPRKVAAFLCLHMGLLLGEVTALRRQDIDHPVLAGYPESHYLKSLWLQMLD